MMTTCDAIRRVPGNPTTARSPHSSSVRSASSGSSLRFALGAVAALTVACQPVDDRESASGDADSVLGDLAAPPADAEQAAARLRSAPIVTLYMDGLARLGCPVRISAEDIRMGERAQHVSAPCPQIELHRQGGFFLTHSETGMLDSIHAYYIVEETEYLQGFSMNGDLIEKEELLSWLENLNQALTRAESDGWVARRLATDTTPGSAEVANLADGAGFDTGTGEWTPPASIEATADFGWCSEGACCACQAEYQTAVNRAASPIIYPGDNAPWPPEAEAAAQAAVDSAPENAALACASCPELGGACEPPQCFEDEDCASIEPKDEYCKMWDDIETRTECLEYYQFDVCKRNEEEGHISCYSSEGDIYADEPATSIPAATCPGSAESTVQPDIPVLTDEPGSECDCESGLQEACYGGDIYVCSNFGNPAGVCTIQRFALDSCSTSTPDDVVDCSDCTGEDVYCDFDLGCQGCEEGWVNCNDQQVCETEGDSCPADVDEDSDCYGAGYVQCTGSDESGSFTGWRFCNGDRDICWRCDSDPNHPGGCE